MIAQTPVTWLDPQIRQGFHKRRRELRASEHVSRPGRSVVGISARTPLTNTLVQFLSTLRPRNDVVLDYHHGLSRFPQLTQEFSVCVISDQRNVADVQAVAVEYPLRDRMQVCVRADYFQREW